jgi:hypothetical protein
MRNRTKWGFKGGTETHEVLKWSELSVNHLQDLKDDVRPLKQGESLMRVLQQDDVKQGASQLLSELKPGMTRSVGNFHMKVTPIFFSATARKKMPCFKKLAAAYAHVGCTSWFIGLRGDAFPRSFSHPGRGEGADSGKTRIRKQVHSIQSGC